MITFEVGKRYDTGRNRYEITSIRENGQIIAGKRFIKTTQKFSGQSYILSWDGGESGSLVGAKEIA